MIDPAAPCVRCGSPAHEAADFECVAAAATQATPPPPRTAATLGLQIGEHVVEQEIGAGGMGTVYRAHHRVSGEQVAIKVLSGVLARDANAIRRFVLEARAINGIRHPNLVNIFSFGQLTDGRYYYIMEYLRGCSLRAMLGARGPMRAEDALPLFLEVLQALDATHARNIVHRDLKPDNVFLVASRDGAPPLAKLLDFGLAKLVAGDTPARDPLTAAGMAVGTPIYMAPEQCKAQPVDGRTDLYALGVMLYEALTGQLPCPGRSTIEIWEAHVRRVPVRPRDLAPDLVSPTLDDLIMKLLAKDPAQRFQSALDVHAALSVHGSTLGPSSLVLPENDAPASALDVAKALPSMIRSTDLVPLGAPEVEPGQPPSAAFIPSEADGVPGELLQARHGELDGGNRAQASALNIDLGPMAVAPVEPLVWMAAPSGRPPRPAPRVARAAEGAKKRPPIATIAVALILALAATIALILTN